MKSKITNKIFKEGLHFAKIITKVVNTVEDTVTHSPVDNASGLYYLQILVDKFETKLKLYGDDWNENVDFIVSMITRIDTSITMDYFRDEECQYNETKMLAGFTIPVYYSLTKKEPRIGTDGKKFYVTVPHKHFRLLSEVEFGQVLAVKVKKDAKAAKRAAKK